MAWDIQYNESQLVDSEHTKSPRSRKCFFLFSFNFTLSRKSFLYIYIFFVSEIDTLETSWVVGMSGALSVGETKMTVQLSKLYLLNIRSVKFFL